MAKTLSDKPAICTACLGPSRDDKTRLTSALTKFSARKYGDTAQSLEQLDNTTKYNPEDSPMRDTGDPTTAVSQINFQSQTRIYAHINGEDPEVLKAVLSGASTLDGGMFVFSASKGIGAQSCASLEMAQQAGLNKAVVFVSEDGDEHDQDASISLESTIREQLTVYGFEGETTPIFYGCLRNWLDDQCNDGKAQQKLAAIFEALDTWIPEPVLGIDKPFLLPIEDVSSSDGHETTIHGQILQGTINVGDTVEVMGGGNGSRKASVTSITMSDEVKEQGHAGSDCELLLQGTKPEDISEGQVLATPGSTKLHSQFRGICYFKTGDEGGRTTPVVSGYKPQFHFPTADTRGSIPFADESEGRTQFNLGEFVELLVALVDPVAMDTGLSFDIREEGRNVAIGQVMEIID